MINHLKFLGLILALFDGKQNMEKALLNQEPSSLQIFISLKLKCMSHTKRQKAEGPLRIWILGEKKSKIRLFIQDYV